ncbi:heme o synthase [Laceyella putida]|uniref:Protoheme IX farnesyltransferase n=1 Tax=Laceyella putida TaxID=110101 RepID=A0ABW2RIA0_9BACL
MERSMPQQSAADPILESLEAASKATWRDFVEVTKPGINKSNLFATFVGYFLAAGFTLFDWSTLVFTLLGTALVIAGGCAINNFYDRDIDPLMERTKTRSVAEGRMKPTVALWYGIILTVVGMLVLGIGVNLLSAVLALVGFVVYVFIYTMWLKRTSTLNTVVGGFSGAVPPMIGWVAVTNSIDLNAWALFLILFMWQPPHFFALAIRKADDYRRAGIPMLPVVKGLKETKKQTLIFTLLLIPSSVLLFVTGANSWFYLVCALCLGVIYIALAIKGFYTDDQEKWSKQMFFYSLIYLTTILLVIMLDVVITESIAMLTK